MCFLQAATFLTLLTGILTVANGGSVPDHGHPTPFLKLVPGTSGAERVSIYFDSPCDGCLDDVDVIKLNLDVDRAENECAGSGVRLNGADLAQSAVLLTTTPSTSRGLFAFNASTASNDIGVGHEYMAEWYLTCLDGQVSLLDVHFSQKADPEHGFVGGFSTSFQQTRRPWIMKLDPTASSWGHEDNDDDDDAAAAADIAAAWAHPEPDESLQIGFPSEAPSSPSEQVPVVSFSLPEDLDLPDGMREQMNKLWKLKAEKQKLNTEINEVVGDVMSLWKAEYAECGTLTCYAQTAFRDVVTMLKVLIHSFTHDANASSDVAVNHTAEHQAPFEPDQLEQQHDDDPATADSSSALITPAPYFPSNDIPLSTSTPPLSRTTLLSRSSSAQPSSKPDVPPPPEPPPASTSVQPDRSDPTPTRPRPAGIETAQPSSSASVTISSASLLEGNPKDDGELNVHLKAAAIAFVVVAVVALLTLACIKFSKWLCRNPRWRVECRARREEWKRRKAYRKAACKHQVRTFFARIKLWTLKAAAADGSDAADEEKNDGGGNKTRNEGSAFSHEIDGLRLASELVGELVVRVEDGRGGGGGGGGGGGEGRIRAHNAAAASISESLPSYSEPPGYSSGADGEISVVDGFTGYTPSGTDESSVASSVLDCSPRMSFDTHSVSTTLYSTDSGD